MFNIMYHFGDLSIAEAISFQIMKIYEGLRIRHYFQVNKKLDKKGRTVLPKNRQLIIWFLLKKSFMNYYQGKFGSSIDSLQEIHFSVIDEKDPETIVHLSKINIISITMLMKYSL